MRSESKPKQSTEPGLLRAEAQRHRNNAVRHLTILSRDLEARMRTGLVENQGFASLRASLGPLFFLLWRRPHAVTALARELGVTKQACSQLANLAERAGYLERIQSPEDGRSKLLHLSPRGRLLVEGSIEIIHQADSDYAEIVGPRRYARFTKTIASLYSTLEIPDVPRLDFLDQATRTVGTLPLITQRAEQALMRATADHGHAGLKLSHSQILPFVGPSGIRISDLVRIHQSSRQAIAGVARDLVSLGYLRRESDPADRRGAILFLSAEGDRLLSDSLAELEALEKRIESTLGNVVLSEFLKTAATLASVLRVGEDVFDVSASPFATARAAVSKESHRIIPNGEMQMLAQQLHQQLGDQQAAQLAELLTERSDATSLRRSRSRPAS